MSNNTRDAIKSGVPDPIPYMRSLMREYSGEWKWTERPRAGVLYHVTSTGDEIWIVRAGTQHQLDAGTIRELCRIADTFAEGHVRFMVRSNIEFMVSDETKVAPLIEALSAGGFPIGGTGNSVSMIERAQGFLYCDMLGTDASGVAKSLRNGLYDEFVDERTPNWARLSTSCCQIICGGQAISRFISNPPSRRRSIMVWWLTSASGPRWWYAAPVAAIRPAVVNGRPSPEVDERMCVCCGTCYPPRPPMQINDPAHSKLAI